MHELEETHYCSVAKGGDHCKRPHRNKRDKADDVGMQ